MMTNPWRLAVIEELIRGKDGLVRAAHIRMGTYKTTRSIVKLYPLEVSSEYHSDVTPDPQDAKPNTDTTSPSVRKRRKAYSEALQKMSEWTSSPQRMYRMT